MDTIFIECLNCHTFYLKKFKNFLNGEKYKCDYCKKESGMKKRKRTHSEFGYKYDE